MLKYILIISFLTFFAYSEENNIHLAPKTAMTSAFFMTAEEIIANLNLKNFPQDIKRLIVIIPSPDANGKENCLKLAEAMQLGLGTHTTGLYTDMSKLDNSMKQAIIVADADSIKKQQKKWKKDFSEVKIILDRPDTYDSYLHDENSAFEAEFSKTLLNLPNVDLVSASFGGWTENTSEARKIAESYLKTQKKLELVKEAFSLYKGGLIVPGGAGFIGSMLVKTAVEMGIPVCVMDSLENGNLGLLPKSPLVTFIETNLRDKTDVIRAFEKTKNLGINLKKCTVIGYAAYAQQMESIQIPEKYYTNNPIIMLNLLTAMEQFGMNKGILSSTSSGYAGITRREEKLLNKNIGLEERNASPQTAYGLSKIQEERLLRQFKSIYGEKGNNLYYQIFRYFNVIGPGEAHETKTRILEVLALRDKVDFYNADKGNEMEGHGDIRDYVDVRDLAYAHLLGSLRLMLLSGDMEDKMFKAVADNILSIISDKINQPVSEGKAQDVINLGSGTGTRTEILFQTASKFLKILFHRTLKVNPVEGPRGPGESEKLIGNIKRGKTYLGLEGPTRSIKKSMWDAYKWYNRLPQLEDDWKNAKESQIQKIKSDTYLERTRNSITLINNWKYVNDDFRFQYYACFLLDMFKRGNNDEQDLRIFIRKFTGQEANKEFIDSLMNLLKTEKVSDSEIKDKFKEIMTNDENLNEMLKVVRSLLARRKVREGTTPYIEDYGMKDSLGNLFAQIAILPLDEKDPEQSLKELFLFFPRIQYYVSHYYDQVGMFFDSDTRKIFDLIMSELVIIHEKHTEIRRLADQAVYLFPPLFDSFVISFDDRSNGSPVKRSA